ncbi:NAD(P)/FAD-dependent oxidoreductase [Aquipuribacter nitratireducens]|uniref:NAD(P)/FAD-dependent oxidoreductase n=1 Tax=Aquipuribacter nitratireducens TaxID=650104 RepID=A0ABW0GMT4_9MICO
MQTRRHDVVVVGGGNAGLSLAARLRRDGCRDVALVDPREVHVYRPLLSYVAGGQATLAEASRPQAGLVPRGCRWYRDRVVAVDADRSTVRLADGGDLAYGDLVLCPGSEVDWDAVPGARAAMATPHAATSYEPDLAERTWPLLAGLRAGTAVFALSSRHTPCSPVGLKPLFLAADHWRRSGVLPDVRIELLVEADRLVAEARADRRLREAAEELGVRVRTSSVVERVDPQARVLRVRTVDGVTEQPYDAFYLAPPYRAPRWVAGSGLTSPGSDGLVAVDPDTLRHRAHPRVWALGDVAAHRTLSSGGALRRQVPVVAHNVAAQRLGQPLRRYDGYTVAPVVTSRRRLLLAEHDRDARPTPTVPWPDLTRPGLATFVVDRYVEPRVYWHLLLRGRV